jgi:hypothetical protein
MLNYRSELVPFIGLMQIRLCKSQKRKQWYLNRVLGNNLQGGREMMGRQKVVLVFWVLVIIIAFAFLDFAISWGEFSEEQITGMQLLIHGMCDACIVLASIAGISLLLEREAPEEEEIIEEEEI